MLMSKSKKLFSTESNALSKRSFLQSIAGIGLGTFAIFGSSKVATADGSDSLGQYASEADKESKKVFVEAVRNSKQYGVVKNLIVDGDFIPQFDDTVAYRLEKESEIANEAGLVARIPTKNKKGDPAEVEIFAFAPNNDVGQLELKVRASYGERPIGMLYTDNEILKEQTKGYVELFPSSSGDSTGVQPFVFGFGWDDLRGAIDTVISEGQEIIDGAADTFNNTADYLENEASGWADKAYEYSDPLLEGITPTPGRDPPQELVDQMNQYGANHVETVDVQRSCIYVGLTLTVGAGITVTMTGVGAGAGTLAVVGGGVVATIAGCEILDMINTFGRDLEDCQYRYVYIFEQKDWKGDTENWYLAFPCE